MAESVFAQILRGVVSFCAASGLGLVQQRLRLLRIRRVDPEGPLTGQAGQQRAAQFAGDPVGAQHAASQLRLLSLFNFKMGDFNTMLRINCVQSSVDSSHLCWSGQLCATGGAANGVHLIRATALRTIFLWINNFNHNGRKMRSRREGLWVLDSLRIFRRIKFVTASTISLRPTRALTTARARFTAVGMTNVK